MSDEITNSPEFKQAVAAAVAEGIAEATDGLKSKNAELLGKLKKAQKDSAIDPADLEAVERERDEWKDKATVASKAATKAASELAAATKRAADTDAAYSNTLRDSALTEALTKNGVTSGPLLRGAKAWLFGMTEVVDDNGTLVVKAGGKSVDDFTTEWAGSDDGKAFVSAPDHTGGGSQGSRSKQTNAPSITRAAFEGLSHSGKMEHIQKQGVVTDA